MTRDELFGWLLNYVLGVWSGKEGVEATMKLCVFVAYSSTGLTIRPLIWITTKAVLRSE